MALEPEARAGGHRARVWRPFPREVAEVVGVEDGGDIRPRMHPWLGIVLVRSCGVATIEARREVALESNWIALIPRFQLFALRQPVANPRAVTLLLAGSPLENLGLSDQPALVTDAALGDEVARLIAQWQRPVRPDEHAIPIGPLLKRLAARGTPLVPARVHRISALIPLRDYLRAQVRRLVATEELARMSGLSEPHLIRAFHYEFGLPPHAYHLRVRLAMACELLSRCVPVASVAYECGFADQSHLSRTFGTVYGLTPAAWAAVTARTNGAAPVGALPRRGPARTWRSRR